VVLGDLAGVVVLPPCRQLGHVRDHPAPASRLVLRERTHPWCIALLRRLRVEGRASGEASSVMARACAWALEMVARGRPW
jgi:hypothetical protein